MQAQLSPARIESILTAVVRRPVTHCEAVSKTAGSDGSCVQRDTFWPAVHETPTVVVQDQGVISEGKPITHDQGHAAMPSCLDMWNKSWFLTQVPVLGAPCCCVTLATDVSLIGWGAVMSCCLDRSLWRGPHLTLHINCLEMLAAGAPNPYVVPGETPLASMGNMGADILLRLGPRPGEWRLHPEVVKKIWRVFGQAQVDLFVTQKASY
ncbi:hypothetical protein H4Q32_021341 [Labeo rohita]|uniref:Uncharacterized protein n=1 Tax=Labeo rohita TaxID=84645 RepID=A0ABQ8M2U9_LABRO|nr:hypothetical protein H4Q32_021341 [Labeo rohita]